MYNNSLVIGRFQPPHLSHCDIIQRAIDLSSNPIVVIGSANKPASERNPFTAEFREELIHSVFPNVVCIR